METTGRYNDMVKRYGEKMEFLHDGGIFQFISFVDKDIIGYKIVGQERDMYLFPPNVNGVPEWVLETEDDDWHWHEGELTDEIRNDIGRLVKRYETDLELKEPWVDSE